MVEDDVAATLGAHAEDPGNPLYTREGAAAAAASDILPPSTLHWEPEDVINGWISAPFHRLPILNVNLKRIGYGSYLDRRFAATLYTGTDAPLGPFDPPLRFPPPDSTVPLYEMARETPDPTTSCAGYSGPVGLPITLEFGRAPMPKVSGHWLGVHDQIFGSRPLQHCVFTAETYQNHNKEEISGARNILATFGTVVIIPRFPLEPGRTYYVSLTVKGGQYSWSFTVGKPEQNLLSLRSTSLAESGAAER